MNHGQCPRVFDARPCRHSRLDRPSGLPGWPSDGACFLLAVGLLLFTLAVLANYGPLHAYMDAKSRLYKAATGVVELEAAKAELQSELGRLSEADYLESSKESG